MKRQRTVNMFAATCEDLPIFTPVQYTQAAEMPQTTVYYYATFGDYRIAVQVPRDWNVEKIQHELIAGFTRATGMVLDSSYSKCFQVEPLYDCTPAQLGYSHEAPFTWRKTVGEPTNFMGRE